MASKKKTVTHDLTLGKVFVTSTFNNTLVSITDRANNVIVWGSAGAVGFKGARRSTPFAASTAVEAVAKKALGMGLKEAEVYIKGPGSGRDAALRALRAAGIKMVLIADITPVPHNGVRPKKKRRV